MPIPLGILAQFRQAAAGDFVLLESQVLGSAQSSITFSNLATYASTYRHLQIRYVARSSRAEITDDLQITYNGNTSNYRRHEIFTDAGPVQAFTAADRVIGLTAGANNAANIFAPGVIDILDGFSSSKNTTARCLTGESSTGRLRLRSNGWFDTASLTSIQLSATGGNLVTGSRFSLFGIRG